MLYIEVNQVLKAITVFRIAENMHFSCICSQRLRLTIHVFIFSNQRQVST